jgi:hypothetical protein
MGKGQTVIGRKSPIFRFSLRAKAMAALEIREQLP